MCMYVHACVQKKQQRTAVALDAVPRTLRPAIKSFLISLELFEELRSSVQV